MNIILAAGDILVSHITDLFNILLDSGCFPQDWTAGIIIPIFKKGDDMDVNNYRGITLVSCFSKLFTIVLNKRVTDCVIVMVVYQIPCSASGKVTLRQMQFLLLHCVIEKYIKKNKLILCIY